MPETLPPMIGPGLLAIPLELPGDWLALRVGVMPGAALLEGGAAFGEAGRWSILAAHPAGGFEVAPGGDRWRIWTRGGIERQGPIGVGPSACSGNDPLAVLGRWIEELGLLGAKAVEREAGGDRKFERSQHLWGGPLTPARSPEGRGTGRGPDPHAAREEHAGTVPDLPPFLGGLIGVLGYDLAPWIERVPRRAAQDGGMPIAAFGLYDTFVSVDHATDRATLWVLDLLGEAPDRVEARARDWLGQLKEEPGRLARSRLGGPLVSNFSAEGYRRAVARAVEYIHAGDIFQANIAQRFEAGGSLEALDLYRRLRERSPAPYSAFLRLGGGRAVVSSSPELFFETEGDRIVTRPIKGTRPRGASASEDAEQVAALIASPKDRAELAMIVDLERNDLGRVCKFGSVRVTEPSVIESFATVHHQVATIEGTLRPGVGPIDVVRAVFPGGSITGAPKIRAMEIIDELEPTRRSLYTGAIGYYGLGGRSAFNIAIRTMLVEGDRVRYQVGGGIVADSDPQSEYEETLHKGRAMRDVLEARG